MINNQQPLSFILQCIITTSRRYMEKMTTLATDCELSQRNLMSKHCQRHNGPEDWVHLAKVTFGVISRVQTQILITFHLQNLDSESTKDLNQTSASPLYLKLKILTKPSFRITTKIQLHNLYKTSEAKYWANSSFKILAKLQLQNLDQPLCSNSEQKFSFRT